MRHVPAATHRSGYTARSCRCADVLPAAIAHGTKDTPYYTITVRLKPDTTYYRPATVDLRLSTALSFLVASLSAQAGDVCA